jgi:hypothetical protein
MNKYRFYFAALCAGVVVLAFGGVTRADFQFNLGVPNSDISAYAGPYEHVDVNLTSSTTATITFTSLTNNGNIYLMGDGGTVAVNVNASSFTETAIGSVTESNAGTGFNTNLPTNPSPKAWTSGQEDGLGSFNLVLDNNDGFKDSADTVSFTVTNTSGTWADASTVLTANGNGYVAAAHVFVTSSPANLSNGAIVTGYAGNSPLIGVVPAPPSIVLLGVGAALGFVPWSRRRSRKAA